MASCFTASDSRRSKFWRGTATKIPVLTSALAKAQEYNYSALCDGRRVAVVKISKMTAPEAAPAFA